MQKGIILISFIILMSLSFNSQAQSIGIRGGLNISSMQMESDGENPDGLKSRLGFNIGVIGEIPIANKFSFETGLVLSQKGMRLKSSEVLEQEMNISMLYLDVPLTGKATFKLGGINCYGLLGPYVGYGLSGDYDYYIEDVFDIEGKTFESSGQWDFDLKRFEFGGIAGAGIILNKVQLGVQYNLGLTNLIDDSSTTYGNSSLTYKNRTLQINLTYKLK